MGCAVSYCALWNSRIESTLNLDSHSSQLVRYSAIVRALILKTGDKTKKEI